MNKKLMLASIIALLVISMAFVATAFAADLYPIDFDFKKGGKYPSITITTTNEASPANDFSGFDVIASTLVLYYYLPTDPSEHTLEPIKVVSAENYITLFFTKKDFPRHADTVRVEGTLQSAETFLSAGPSWAWGRTR